MNLELPTTGKESFFWKAFWFVGKCVITLGAAFTIQNYVHTYTTHRIETDELLLATVLIVVGIKMWSR